MNQPLEELIQAINHVSLNHEDLIESVIDFSKIHFKKNKEAEIAFDGYWDNYFFIEQASISSREAIVLAMHALTLDAQVDFSQIIEHCTNPQAQAKNIAQISKNVEEKKKLHHFFSELKKELFSRIYSENKSLSKLTQLSSDVLKDRYTLFINGLT